mmetsp:Transcript_1703/g.3983  ORF Transcript_1703/g.3983 Transcript_1703/m.3983 type:complete len:94 (+) Transcript_1703:112-393(+)
MKRKNGCFLERQRSSTVWIELHIIEILLRRLLLTMISVISDGKNAVAKEELLVLTPGLNHHHLEHRTNPGQSSKRGHCTFCGPQEDNGLAMIF